jgi:ABC-type uncharacterized transport system YnjBCD substrate-binding protein
VKTHSPKPEIVEISDSFATHFFSSFVTSQSTVYVNVYEAGKCSVLAVPDIAVAEELADVVSDMLLDAFKQVQNPRPSTLNPQPSTLNPQPSTLNPQPSTLSPQPSTLNPQPSTLNHRP